MVTTRATGFAVRPATREDADALAHVNAVVQALHHEHLPSWFKPPDAVGTADLFRQWLDDPVVRLSIAEADNGEPLGYVLARVIEAPASALTYAATIVELDQIAVVPDHRRRGVGRALVDAVKELADSVDAGRVQLTVWEFNGPAQQFFAANGFTVAMRRMLLADRA